MIVQPQSATAALSSVDERDDAELPFFCCCEFVDRHGNVAHLADTSACDDALCSCCGPAGVAAGLRSVLADCDDRLRLPMHGGALYLGFEGMAGIALVCLQAALARQGVGAAIATVASVLAGLHVLECACSRWGRRSGFFRAWCFGSAVCAYTMFTLCVAEHVWFGWWLLVTVSEGTGVFCVHALMHTAAAGEPEQSVALSPAASGSAEVGRTRDSVGRRHGRCAHCRGLEGYPHYYTAWLNACVHEHNRGELTRALWWCVFANLLVASCTFARIRFTWMLHASPTFLQGQLEGNTPAASAYHPHQMHRKEAAITAELGVLALSALSCLHAIKMTIHHIVNTRALL